MFYKHQDPGLKKYFSNHEAIDLVGMWSKGYPPENAQQPPSLVCISLTVRGSMPAFRAYSRA